MRGYIVPLIAGARIGRLWRMVRRDSIPVLLLHGVLPEDQSRRFNATGKFITPGQLEGFIRRISSVFSIIPLDEICSALAEGRKLENVMALTFDDGYANNFTYAFPVLSRMQVPFTVFVSTGFVDSTSTMWSDRLELAVSEAAPGRAVTGLAGGPQGLSAPGDRLRTLMQLKERFKRMTADDVEAAVERVFEDLDVDPGHAALESVRFMSSGQIARMAGQGVSFGSHTVSHPILSREPASRVRAEVCDSKSRLEAITGRECRLFAYPNGRREDFNHMVKQEVARAGYVAAVTTVHGLAGRGCDPLEIPRISVDCRWSYEVFETRVSGVLSAFRKEARPAPEADGATA
jgi:peptidoglycan/xylan/chitin deacetylase (PgdA/CDA1 family)